MNDSFDATDAAPCRVLNEAYPFHLWFSVFVALLGSLQYGYGYSVLNTALDRICADINYDSPAFINSAVVLGSAVGAITAGILADHYGPKKAQVYNVGAFLLGSVLTSINLMGYQGFLAGRLMTGFGAGASSLYAPRYIAEIAPRELRGRLVSLCQVLVNVGILAGYCVGIPYQYDWTCITVWGMTMPWWRVMTVLAAVPALIQLVCLLFCPESPMWLESRDKELADEACIKLWGSRAILFEAVPGDTEHCGRSGAAALLAAQAMYQPPADDARGGLGWNELKSVSLPAGVLSNEGWRALLRREYRWMLSLALSLPVLQQACGVNTVILYSSDVFQGAGLAAPIWAIILLGVVNLVFTLLAASLMDRWGRRPLMLISYAGMAAALVTVAWINSPLSGPHSDDSGLVTAVLFICYMVCFALGAGPVTALYLSEILPKRIKGKAAALATALAWLSNLAVTLTFFPLMTSLTLGGVYLMYGIFTLLALVYLYVVMPETKCRTWREIEAMLLLPPPLKLRDLMTASVTVTEPLLRHGQQANGVSH